MATHVQFRCSEFNRHTSTRLAVALVLYVGLSGILCADSRPEVFYQSTHLEPVTAIAITPDGRYALSSSEDRTMKLWNLATGKLERNISLGAKNASGYHAYGIAVSPDGRYAFTAGVGGIKQWQISTGLLFRTFPRARSNSAFIMSYFISISPNGRQLLCGGGHSRFELWDIATGRQIQSFSTAKFSPAWAVPVEHVSYAVFSPDGKEALSEGPLGTLALWNVATGEMILNLVLPRDHEGWKRGGGFGGNVNRIKSGFSPSGDRIIVGDDSGRIRVYDTLSGRLLKALPVFGEAVLALTVLPDGNLIAATGNKVALVDMTDGRQLKIYEQGFTLPNYTYCASQKFLVIGTTDGGLGVWDVQAAVQIFAFRHISPPQSVAVSPDGRFAAVKYVSNLVVWDLASGTQLKRIDSQLKHEPDGLLNGSPDTALAFSPDGLHIATFGTPKALEVWNISTGQRLFTVEPFLRPLAMAYSPDGQYILLTAASGATKFPDENEFELRRADTGAFVKTFRFGKSAKALLPNEKKHERLRYVLTATFSPDSKSILVGDGTSLMLWDIFADKPLQRFEHIPEDSCHLEKESPSHKTNSVRVCNPAPGPLNAAIFSPDGKQLFTVFEFNFASRLLVWDVENGKLVRVLTPPLPYSAYYRQVFRTLEFSKDGRSLMFGNDSAIEIWDSVNFSHVSALQGHKDTVQFVRFIAGGQGAISASTDGTLRIWDVGSSKELLQMISFEDQEWISEAPVGYYTSSLKGDTYLNVRLDNSVFGIDQWRPAFYKPDIIKQILRFGQPNATSALPESPTSLARENPVAPPRLSILYPADGARVETNTVQLAFHTEDARETIQSIKIRVNGATVLEPTKSVADLPPNVGGKEHAVDLKVPLLLDPGDNVVEVRVSNGIAEATSHLRLYSPTEAARACAELPTLWVLAIGINQYNDKRFQQLKYAAADAKAIVDLLKKQECKEFHSVNAQLITDDSALHPTYDNVVKGLAFLKQAKQQDVVMLFIASHGATDRNGDFYLIPSDAVLQGAMELSKALSWSDLKSVFELDAKTIVLIDACHSGSLTGEERLGRGDINRFLKQIQESRPAIFSSTRANEVASESSKFLLEPASGHGAFTFAILKGLMGCADFFKLGKVQIAELDTYVTTLVPVLTNYRQNPTIDIPAGYKSLFISEADHDHTCPSTP